MIKHLTAFANANWLQFYAGIFNGSMTDGASWLGFCIKFGLVVVGEILLFKVMVSEAIVIGLLGDRCDKIALPPVEVTQEVSEQ